MCAPCKEIINEEATNGAMMGSRIRELILHPPPDVEPDSPEDDMMFQLAEYEVEYILAGRKAAVDYAKMIGASPRWQRLMARVFGSGYDSGASVNSSPANA